MRMEISKRRILNNACDIEIKCCTLSKNPSSVVSISNWTTNFRIQHFFYYWAIDSNVIFSNKMTMLWRYFHFFLFKRCLLINIFAEFKIFNVFGRFSEIFLAKVSSAHTTNFLKPHVKIIINQCLLWKCHWIHCYVIN